MDLENAKQEFLKFTSNYDLAFPKMKRKFEHSFRVMENAKNIANRLCLTDKKIEIATLIGLLHDIGHFEQIKVKDILKEDKKIDHGDLGVEILQNNNYIRKYMEEDTFDNVIFESIKNHNKFKIEQGLTKEELLYAKIIRDADKLDIFYECTELFWSKEEQIKKINNSKITDEIFNMFTKYVYWDRTDSKTEADIIVFFISLIFDINFKYSFEVIKREKYIERILRKFKFEDITTSNRMKQVLEIANQYLEKRTSC